MTDHNDVTDLYDLTPSEMRAAEKAELVIRDDGTGFFRVLKDREYGGREYNLDGLLGRLREAAKVRKDGVINLVWVRR